MKTQLVRRKSDGFTLIEIMVVVIILGIMAATIMPQFMGATQEAKVSTAKANISELESAIERFYIHMDRYPTTEEGLKVLVEPPQGEESSGSSSPGGSSDSSGAPTTKWRGPYIKTLHPDPWGNPYQYKNPGTHRLTGYDIWSRGADGADGGEKEAADIGNW